MGRIQKFSMYSGDAVVCGKAHVRLKKMQAAGDSIREEVKLMSYTSPQYWREVFQDRRREFSGFPNDEAGAVFARPKKRVCCKTSPDNCCRRLVVRIFYSGMEGGPQVVDYEDRARWGPKQEKG